MTIASLMGVVGLAIPVSLAAVQTPGPAPVNQQQPPPSAAPAAVSPQRALLDRYCVTCHNQKLRTAGLTLDTANVTDLSQDGMVWEKVLRKIRAREMPPPTAPRRPDEATYASFASWLETTLDQHALANPNPGRVPDHRLNRAEYGNAVRDLLGLDIDSQSLLPGDDSAYGFDNIADVQAMSPALLARYMSASAKISRLAVGDPHIDPVFETYEVPYMLTQAGQAGEDLPFGSRGGMAVRHIFPLDGEYVIKIRLKRVGFGTITGLAEAHQLDVRVDGVRVKLFTVGGVDRKDRPEDYAFTADNGLEVRLPIKAGPRKIAVTFVQATIAPEGVLEAPISVILGNPTNEPGVGTVEIGGPFDAVGPGDTPSQRKIFVCRPSSAADEQPCARKILSALARRAYRRPLEAADVETLLRFFRDGRKGRTFDEGIERGIRRILVDPEFLFRTEPDPVSAAAETNYRISDLQLASRLSFFLWSSIPDDELLDVASRGRLRDAAVLEQEVRRMLADPRAGALMSNFAGQWLHLRRLKAMTPDPRIFPDFDEELRQGFQRETELFFDSMVREDRSMLDLLSAKYSFVNERLARHYGMPNVYGSHFRRVAVSDERAGLLGQGSILTVTSYGNRTSPVLRGKWILENIFNQPPPPPPANVPALKLDAEEGKPTTLRERMEQHRKNPVCASCHTRMDPLGFALENFDAVGKWRTSDGNVPVDALAVLPNGTKMEGVNGLRKVVVSRGEEFVGTVAEKLLTYALGRGLEYYDQPTIRMITRDAAANDYRWSSLILGIVKSTPFQMRRSRPSEKPVSVAASRP